MEYKSNTVTEGRPNRWIPVTEQYTVNLDPAACARLLDPQQVRRDFEAKRKAEKMPPPPAGLIVITWYYFLRAVAYSVFASMLLADPLSSYSAWLYSHLQALVPLSQSQIRVNTFDVFLGALVLTAALSAVLGLLWMFRFPRVRLITLAVLGLTLSLNMAHLVTNQIGDSAVLAAVGLKNDVLLASAIDAAIFCCLAISQNVARAIRVPV